MARHPGMIAALLLSVLAAACGSDPKKPPRKPVVEDDAPPAPKGETEADREAKRREAALAIVPEGTSCLPPALKEPDAPRLELGAIGKDAVVCAIDTDESRLLGPVGCWTVNLESGALTYREPSPIPSHGVSVRLDEGCARGYCLPKGKEAEAPVAHMSWSSDGSKVAVLAGDEVHVFAADGKAHETSFSIRGDEGVPNTPLAVHWVGDAIYVEGKDDGPYAAVWAFKPDGTPIGGIEAIGSKDGKPLSTHGGSFSILDKNRVGVSEHGLSTLTIYESDTGKRAKLVRKLKKPPCKSAEIESWWADEEVSAKCKKHMTANFGYLIGATAVAGSKSFLVLLRGNRLGELGVLDIKTLAEKKAIKMPWCEGGGSDDADADSAP